MTPGRLCACLALILLIGGCTTVKPPAKPTRTPLPRPIVIIGGIVDPGITATHVARYIGGSRPANSASWRCTPGGCGASTTPPTSW